MVNAHVVIPDEGEPRVTGRRIPILTVALKIGGTDVTIEEYADAHDLDVQDVIAALSWAAHHEEWMRSLIEERAQAMQKMAEKEYPEFVAGPEISDEDVADFRRRARRALRDVVEDWRRYGDNRFRDREE